MLLIIQHIISRFSLYNQFIHTGQKQTFFANTITFFGNFFCLSIFFSIFAHQKNLFLIHIY